MLSIDLTGVVNRLNHDHRLQEEDSQNQIVTEPMTGGNPQEGLRS